VRDPTDKRVRNSDGLHSELTRVILNAAYEVHTKVGPGLLERPYRICLAYELEKRGLKIEMEKLLPVVYDGHVIDLGYRVDLLVAGAVIIEVKAVVAILPVHEAQLLSYLRLSGRRVGLLINFHELHLRNGIRRRVIG
jgi:GxxExxY protein